MRRLAIAVLAIVGVLSVGIMASGAYFTDTVTTTNYHFTTGSAALEFGFCTGGLNADCSAVPANLHDYAFVTSQLTGPDQTGAGCLVVQNTGQYALNLTAAVTNVTEDKPGMWDAFQVSTEIATSSCNGTGVYVYGNQSLHSAYSAGNVTVPGGALAPGGRIYLIQRNFWDSTGNQNAMENGNLYVNTALTGQTN